MTRGSVITASTRSGAPQRGQWRRSMSNTRALSAASRSSLPDLAVARARHRGPGVWAAALARRGGGGGRSVRGRRGSE
jgi:hypothetical protein